jgi:hypothetical protein
MRIYLFILLNFIAVSKIEAQNSIFIPAESLNIERLIPVSSGIAVGWAGSMIGLHEIWYKNIEKSKFHTFDDRGNWLQMDKAGHLYTNYEISLLTSDLFKWSGLKSKTAAIIGTGIGLGYQTTLELFDGYSADWGFSWGDIGSNTLGAGLFLSQELIWNEQRLIPKFSFQPSEFARLRPSVLGSNFPEQLLKDYNGQTYWLSFNPFLFAKGSTFPKWICLSFGYSVNEKIIGDKESYIDYSGISAVTYNAHREFLISFDIDFSRIPVKKPWLKVLFRQLNYLKVPFPALLISNGKLSGSALYF